MCCRLETQTVVMLFVAGIAPLLLQEDVEVVVPST